MNMIIDNAKICYKKDMICNLYRWRKFERWISWKTGSCIRKRCSERRRSRTTKEGRKRRSRTTRGEAEKGKMKDKWESIDGEGWESTEWEGWERRIRAPLGIPVTVRPRASNLQHSLNVMWHSESEGECVGVGAVIMCGESGVWWGLRTEARFSKPILSHDQCKFIYFPFI